MTRRCSRCGHPATDAVGSPQCALFDVAPADPRATDAARAELRAGRVLCSACQRTPDLFPTVAPVVVTAPTDHFPRPVVDYWTRGQATFERDLLGHWTFDVDPADVDGSVDRGMQACVDSMLAQRCETPADEPVIGMLDGRLVEVVCK